MKSIAPDRLGESQLFSLSFWKTIVGEALAIVLIPIGTYLSFQPLGSNLCQQIQNVIQRLPDHFNPGGGEQLPKYGWNQSFAFHQL